MHPLDALEEELDRLKVAEHVDPQHEEKIYDHINHVERAYPEEALPESWDTFKALLENVLEGVRDTETTEDLLEQYKTARTELP